MSFQRICGLVFIASLCLCLATCEKCGITDPEPGIPVTLSFDVYSHIKGYEKSFSIEAESGQDVTIAIDDLEVEGVDAHRIAVRSCGFHDLVVFDKTGDATFAAPEENTAFNIILFNTIPGLDYDMMDRQSAVLYNGVRHYIVYRKDCDGHPKDWRCGFSQEKPWRVSFEHMDKTLDRGWVRWGSFLRKPAPNDSQGDFSYGYGECHGCMGWHTGLSISVNECLLFKFKDMLAISFAEIFENVTSVDNIGIDGGGGSYDVVTDENGRLNEVGKHLLLYVFAKDSAPLD
jgi:hypothetical protein